MRFSLRRGTTGNAVIHSLCRFWYNCPITVIDSLGWLWMNCFQNDDILIIIKLGSRTWIKATVIRCIDCDTYQSMDYIVIGCLKENTYPDSEVHGATMGPIWGRQGPGGPHVGPMNVAIWVTTRSLFFLPKDEVMRCMTYVCHWTNWR